MRTARAHGVPLSVLRGEAAPGDRWSTRDRQLAVALTTFEASLCGGCGIPQWVAFDPEVLWDVDDAPYRCLPCTARDASAEAWMDDTVKQPSALRWSVRQYVEPNN